MRPNWHNCEAPRLFAARQQDVGAQEHPERIVGDERNLDEYADEREERDQQRNSEYQMQRTLPRERAPCSEKHIGDSGNFEAKGLLDLVGDRQRSRGLL